MKTLIVTDSNCDLSVEYIIENNIPVIPFYFNLQGRDYKDDFGRTIGYKAFYSELRLGETSTTAQITPYNFEEYFKEKISSGYSIIYIGFSSALSETYNNAVTAKKSILEENKYADITVIDTKNATVGQGLIVYYANEMLKQGKSKEDIIIWIEENKLKVNILFTVHSLDHLKRGGRISATSATIGTILDVKPMLYLDKDGKIDLMKKLRGRKKAIRSLLEEFQANVINPEDQVIFINHADCIDDAVYLKTLLVNAVKVKNVVINYVGPVIGAHTGPGMLCIAFIGKNRF